MMLWKSYLLHILLRDLSILSGSLDKARPGLQKNVHSMIDEDGELGYVV